MAVMNCKQVFNNELRHFSLKNSSIFRNKIQNSTSFIKCIHSVFLPKDVKRCPPVEKISSYSYPLRSSSNICGRMRPSNSRLGVRSLSDGNLASAKDEVLYSAADQKAILHEFNTASHEALCSFGFRTTAASAAVECRPFRTIVEVMKVPGIGYSVLTKACRRVYDVVQQKKDPVQPSVTQQWAQEFRDVVSVCVQPGYVAYAHLTLCPAPPSSSLTYGTNTSIENKESVLLSDELLHHTHASGKDSVEVTDLDLLPVETTDPKLHQHKLLQKVRAAMYKVPQCRVYVMPVSGVMVSTKPNVTEVAITMQRAQIMGAVQGLLAQRCAVQASEMRYVKDTVVHDVFSLRVGKNIVTNLELLMKLLNGHSISSPLQDYIAVPQITTPPNMKEYFTSLGGSRQRTLAPAIYNGMILCSIVAATRTENNFSSI